MASSGDIFHNGVEGLHGGTFKKADEPALGWTRLIRSIVYPKRSKDTGIWSSKNFEKPQNTNAWSGISVSPLNNEFKIS